MGWSTNRFGTVMMNGRVTCDVPGVLKDGVVTAAAAINAGFLNTATNVTDFANLVWTVDYVSPTTGRSYPNCSITSVVHDSVVTEAVTQVDTMIAGATLDVRFRLKWATSGNPVKNAIVSTTAPGISGGSVATTLKVIDADNGIYAHTVTINTTATSIQLTPRWTYPDSANQYTGTSLTLPVSTPLTVTVPMIGRSSYGPVPAPATSTFVAVINPGEKNLRPDAKLVSVAGNSYMTATGTVNLDPYESGIYRVPVSSPSNAAGSTNETPLLNTPASQVFTFSKGGTTYTYNGSIPMVPMAIPVTSVTELTTMGGEIELTVMAGLNSSSDPYYPIATGVVTTWALYGMDGEVITGTGGLNRYTTDGKVVVNIPAIPKLRRATLQVQMGGYYSTTNRYWNVAFQDIDVKEVYTSTVVNNMIPVGTPSTVTFSLNAPAGVTYSNPTVNIVTNPWTTSSALTDNGDGTYSITVTPSKETGARTIRLDVIQGGVTYSHGVQFTAYDDGIATLKFDATADIFGTTTGLFSLVDRSGNLLPWRLSGTSGNAIDRTKLLLSMPTATVGTTRTFTENLDLRLLTISSQPVVNTASVDSEEGTWSADVVNPLTKRIHKLTAKSTIHTAITTTWVDDSSWRPIVGNPTDVRLKIVYASGKPVTNAVYLASAPHTVEIAGSATWAPSLKAIDAANGIYAGTITPLATRQGVIFLKFGVGSSTKVNKSVTRFSYGTIGATAYIPAMNNFTRTVSIKLVDMNGAIITDAVVTNIAAGDKIDASSGSWPCVDTSLGMYYVQIVSTGRGPTTQLYSDKVLVTYTRGGVVTTAYMDVKIYHLNAKVVMPSNLTTDAAADTLPAGTKQDGTKMTETTGYVYGTAYCTMDYNSVFQSGAPYLNPTNLTVNQTFTIVRPVGLANVDLVLQSQQTNYVIWSEPFRMVPGAFYYRYTPYNWQWHNLAYATGKNYIGAQVLPNLEVLFTDQANNPITGLRITAATGTTLQPADRGTDWSTSLVPKTDGSDGKYLVKWYTPEYMGNHWQSTTITITVVSDQMPTPTDLTLSLYLATN